VPIPRWRAAWAWPAARSSGAIARWGAPAWCWGHLELATRAHLRGHPGDAFDPSSRASTPACFDRRQCAWEKNAATFAPTAHPARQVAGLEKNATHWPDLDALTMIMDITKFSSACRTAIRSCWWIACWSSTKGKRIRALKNVHEIERAVFHWSLPAFDRDARCADARGAGPGSAILAFDNLGVLPDDKTVFYFVASTSALQAAVEPGDQIVRTPRWSAARRASCDSSTQGLRGRRGRGAGGIMCTMRRDRLSSRTPTVSAWRPCIPPRSSTVGPADGSVHVGPTA